MKNCSNCRHSTVGDFNTPMVAAHEYQSERYTFSDGGDTLVAIPIYELECENERNWLPSRGNMLVHTDDVCKHHEPNNREVD